MPAAQRASENGAPPADAKVLDYKFTVIETHLDIFGHMNNAVYLKVFEDARWAVITERGFGLREIMGRKQGPVILEVDLAFKKELRNREAITIRTWCENYTGKIGQLVQVMINEKGEECARAIFVFGLFDLERRRLIDATPEWRVAVGVA